MTLFLTGNRVDLLRIAVAPFFVGESGAPRFVRAGAFPFGKDRRMEVLQVRQVGDMSVTDYSLSRREPIISGCGRPLLWRLTVPVRIRLIRSARWL